MASDLFEQAQMEYANANMGPNIPTASIAVSESDSAIRKRLDELLPPL